jgi:hypothetical protein
MVILSFDNGMNRGFRRCKNMKNKEFTCFDCANSHVDEEDKLHCILKDGIIVEDNDSCEKYN